MPYMEHLGVQWCTNMSANLLEFFSNLGAFKIEGMLIMFIHFLISCTMVVGQRTIHLAPLAPLIPLSSESCCLGGSFRQHFLYGT